MQRKTRVQGAGAGGSACPGRLGSSCVRSLRAVITLFRTRIAAPTNRGPNRPAGGQWARATGGGAGGEGDGEAAGGGPGAALPQGLKDKGKATKAMGVDEFLEKGVGGAQLPRKR